MVDISTELKIIEILDIAGTTERMIPGLRKPNASRMYDLLDISYSRNEEGYYNKKPMRLHPNPKQYNCWELAIEILLLVDLDQRRLLWARSCKFSWSALAKQFGCHRVTIKKRYLETIFIIKNIANKNLLDKINKI